MTRRIPVVAKNSGKVALVHNLGYSDQVDWDEGAGGPVEVSKRLVSRSSKQQIMRGRTRAGIEIAQEC
jgi:hypothetical protein